ncbi:MAG TPA: nitroreductase family deazaflavin-dependent oxidoreductase [Candidatus Limnocylindria bacterium]|nr:nitroreductase family deazaflavin-dependent oxidoreductase [Candidatus Limnocylindria bacterium]
MDDRIRRALSRGHLIDLTTTGRRTGQPRRVELVFHAIDGHVYISGMPGFPRSWLANIRADPRVTFHLKGTVTADLPATAREITEPTERRRVMEQVASNWQRTDVDRMMVQSPLIEVIPDALAASAGVAS